MKLMPINRSHLIVNGHLRLALTILAALSGLIFSTQVSAQETGSKDSVQSYTATLERIDLLVQTSESNSPLSEWMNDRYQETAPPQLELRIDESETITLDQSYSYNNPVDITRQQPAGQANDSIIFFLKIYDSGSDSQHEWQKVGSSEFYQSTSYPAEIQIPEANLELILQSIPESTNSSVQESNEPSNGSETNENSPGVEPEVEDTQNLDSQSNDNPTLQQEFINDLNLLNIELRSRISALDDELETLQQDQEPPNTGVTFQPQSVSNQNDSSWTSYVLLGLIVAILTAAIPYFYKRMASSSRKEESQHIEENYQPSRIGRMDTYFNLRAEYEEAVEYIKELRLERSKIETENTNLQDSIKAVQGDNAKLNQQNEQLQSIVNQVQPYLENQEKLDDIKTTYKELQETLKSLINTSSAATPLLSNVVDWPIDTEKEYYRASGRLESLEVIKAALDDYHLRIEEITQQSVDYAREINNANASKQIEFIKQFVDARTFDSLTTIPRILENIQQSIGRTDVDEEVFSEITAYEQHLADRFSSNDRTVPMAVLNLLENLCRNAESGEIDAIEKLTKYTIQALKPIYGTGVEPSN